MGKGLLGRWRKKLEPLHVSSPHVSRARASWGGSKEERITGTLLFSCPSSAGIAEGRFLGRMKLEEPKESQHWSRISSQPREGQGQSPGQRQAPSVEGAEGGEQEPAASLVNTHHLHTREQKREGEGRRCSAKALGKGEGDTHQSIICAAGECFAPRWSPAVCSLYDRHARKRADPVTPNHGNDNR